MGAKTPVLLVSIIHPEGAAVRKREKHARVVTLRDGDGGRLLARLTHRIVDFSKHTSEGAEEPSALCQWMKEKDSLHLLSAIELLSPNLWVIATINKK